jgi:hypothetical protein
LAIIFGLICLLTPGIAVGVFVIVFAAYMFVDGVLGRYLSAGVTLALNQLDRKGVIRLSRGRIEIVDCEGLITSANGTYGIP